MFWGLGQITSGEKWEISDEKHHNTTPISVAAAEAGHEAPDSVVDKADAITQVTNSICKCE